MQNAISLSADTIATIIPDGVVLSCDASPPPHHPSPYCTTRPDDFHVESVRIYVLGAALAWGYDIETTIRVSPSELCHVRISSGVARQTFTQT